MIIGPSRSSRSARGPLVGGFRTLVQYGYCTRVSGGRLSDIGAVRFLRYGLMTSGIRPSCSWRSALGPLVGGFDKTRMYNYAIYNINRGVGGIV